MVTDAAILTDANAPGARAFGHEGRVACADHDRHSGLKKLNHRGRNHGKPTSCQWLGKILGER